MTVSLERGTLFAYGLTNATAIQKPHHLFLINIQSGFTLLVPAYSGCLGKEAIKQMLLCSISCQVLY